MSRDGVLSQCGELVCGALQYCSALNALCLSCSEICLPGSRRNQTHNCHQQCQVPSGTVRVILGVIADIPAVCDVAMSHRTASGPRHRPATCTGYLQLMEHEQVLSAVAGVQQELHTLTLQVNIVLGASLICLLLLLLLVTVRRWHCCRRRRSADIEAGDSIELKKIGATIGNGTSCSASVIHPKANTVPQYTLGRHNPSFLMACKHGDELKARARFPAEDTCPGEFSAAYDNPALSVTPPPTASGASSALTRATSSVSSTDGQGHQTQRADPMDDDQTR